MRRMSAWPLSLVGRAKRGWRGRLGAASDAGQQVLLASTDDRGVRRAARGSALNLLGAGVSAIATFGLTAVIAHGASKADAGVFFSATSVFVLLISVGQLGTTNGLVYFLARANALGRADLHRRYLRAAFVPVFACALAAGAALFVLAQPIAALVSPDHQRLAAGSLRVLAWFIPAASLENMVMSASRGLGTMRPYTVVEQVLRPVLQILLAALIMFGALHLNLAWSWAVPYAVAGIVGWVWLRHMLPRDESRMSDGSVFTNDDPHAGPKVGREFWRFTAPRSFAGVSQVALQRLDIVLVGALAGAPAAALYTAATRFVVLGQFTRSAVSRAIQPHLAEAMTNDSKVAVRRLYQASTAWLMAVTWPIYLVMIADPGPMVGMFGHGYGVASSVLVILAISMLLATLCGDVDVMLVMSGRTSLSLVNLTVALAVNVALDFWLIPWAGITGAALSWAIAIVVKNLLALVQVARVFKLHPIGRGTATVSISSVASFVGCLAVSRTLFGEGLLGLLTGCVLGSLLYCALLWRFGDEIELQAFLSRGRGSRLSAASAAVDGG